MDYIFPSEVGRLVLGYLESRGCHQTASLLLQELPELTEIAQLRRQGRKTQSRVWQLSLTDFLLDYAYCKEIVQTAAEKHPNSMGYLLEKNLLSDQLRCIISSVTAAIKHVSTTPEAVCVKTKQTNKIAKRIVNSKQQIVFPANCPPENCKAVDSEVATSQLLEEGPVPLDDCDAFLHTSALQKQLESKLGQQHQQAASADMSIDGGPKREGISTTMADTIDASAINSEHAGVKPPRLSPKRKGFQVRRRINSDSNILLNEYQDQLTRSVMNNTAFHEHIASVINKTLAQSGYQIVNEEYDSSAADFDKHPQKSASSSEADAAPAAAAAVNAASSAGNCGTSNFDKSLTDDILAHDSLPPHNQAHANQVYRNNSVVTPSKMSSTVAETVSKMLLDDPNYQDLFFLALGNESSCGSKSPPRSSSPHGRLLCTPVPQESIPQDYDDDDVHDTCMVQVENCEHNSSMTDVNESNTLHNSSSHDADGGNFTQNPSGLAKSEMECRIDERGKALQNLKEFNNTYPINKSSTTLSVYNKNSSCSSALPHFNQVIDSYSSGGLLSNGTESFTNDKSYANCRTVPRNDNYPDIGETAGSGRTIAISAPENISDFTADVFSRIESHCDQLTTSNSSSKPAATSSYINTPLPISKSLPSTFCLSNSGKPNLISDPFPLSAPFNDLPMPNSNSAVTVSAGSASCILSTQICASATYTSSGPSQIHNMTSFNNNHATCFPTSNSAILSTCVHPAVSCTTTAPQHTSLPVSVSSQVELSNPSSCVTSSLQSPTLQTVNTATPAPPARIPIISKTIPCLDNTASFKKELKTILTAYALNTAVDSHSNVCSNTGMTALGASASSSMMATTESGRPRGTFLVNDASPLIPTSVRNAILPMLNSKEGSVISIAGTSATGLNRGVLTVIHVPDANATENSKKLKTLIPKPMDGSEINKPMTVTLANEVEITVKSTVVQNIKKKLKPKQIKPTRRRAFAPPRASSTLATEKQSTEGRCKKKDVSLTKGDEMLVAALNASLFAKTPEKCTSVLCPTTDGNESNAACHKRKDDNKQEDHTSNLHDSEVYITGQSGQRVETNAEAATGNINSFKMTCLEQEEKSRKTRGKKDGNRNLDLAIPIEEVPCIDRNNKDPSKEFVSVLTSSHLSDCCSQVNTAPEDGLQPKSEEKRKIDKININVPETKTRNLLTRSNKCKDVNNKNNLHNPTVDGDMQENSDMQVTNSYDKDNEIELPSLEYDCNANDVVSPKKGVLEETKNSDSSVYTSVKNNNRTNVSATETVMGTVKSTLKFDICDRTMSAVKISNMPLNDDILNRRSYSTPSYKRRKNHVRVLDFQTPNKTTGAAESARALIARSLFNSPSTQKKKISPSKRVKGDIQMKKTKAKKRTLDVIEEESQNSNQLEVMHNRNGYSSSAAKRRKHDITRSKFAAVSSTQESCVASPSIVQHTQANCADLADITSHSSQQIPYIHLEYFTTPLKFPELALEPPTPLSQCIPSTNKKQIQTDSKNDLNTPLASAFPPSPYPRTPCGKGDYCEINAHQNQDETINPALKSCIANDVGISLLDETLSLARESGITVEDEEKCDDGSDICEIHLESKNVEYANTKMSPTSMGIAIEQELQRSLNKNVSTSNNMEPPKQLCVSPISINLKTNQITSKNLYTNSTLHSAASYHPVDTDALVQSCSNSEEEQKTGGKSKKRCKKFIANTGNAKESKNNKPALSKRKTNKNSRKFHSKKYREEKLKPSIGSLCFENVKKNREYCKTNYSSACKIVQDRTHDTFKPDSPVHDMRVSSSPVTSPFSRAGRPVVVRPLSNRRGKQSASTFHGNATATSPTKVATLRSLFGSSSDDDWEDELPGIDNSSPLRNRSVLDDCSQTPMEDFVGNCISNVISSDSNNISVYSSKRSNENNNCNKKLENHYASESLSVSLHEKHNKIPKSSYLNSCCRSVEKDGQQTSVASNSPSKCSMPTIPIRKKEVKNSPELSIRNNVKIYNNDVSEEPVVLLRRSTRKRTSKCREDVYTSSTKTNNTSSSFSIRVSECELDNAKHDAHHSTTACKSLSTELEIEEGNLLALSCGTSCISSFTNTQLTEVEAPVSRLQSPSQVKETGTSGLSAENGANSKGTTVSLKPNNFSNKKNQFIQSFGKNSDSCLGHCEEQPATAAVRRLGSALLGLPITPLGSPRLSQNSSANGDPSSTMDQLDDTLSDAYMELDHQLAILDGASTNQLPSYPNVYSHVSNTCESHGKNLLLFTPLPKTPEKDIQHICRSMIRDGAGAMVALPSSQPNFKSGAASFFSTVPELSVDKRVQASDAYNEDEKTDTSNGIGISECMEIKECNINANLSSDIHVLREHEVESLSEDEFEEYTCNLVYSDYMDLLGINIDGKPDILEYPLAPSTDKRVSPTKNKSSVATSKDDGTFTGHLKLSAENLQSAHSEGIALDINKIVARQQRVQTPSGIDYDKEIGVLQLHVKPNKVTTPKTSITHQQLICTEAKDPKNSSCSSTVIAPVVINCSSTGQCSVSNTITTNSMTSTTSAVLPTVINSIASVQSNFGLQQLGGAGGSSSVRSSSSASPSTFRISESSCGPLPSFPDPVFHHGASKRPCKEIANKLCVDGEFDKAKNAKTRARPLKSSSGTRRLNKKRNIDNSNVKGTKKQTKNRNEIVSNLSVVEEENHMVLLPCADIEETTTTKAYIKINDINKDRSIYTAAGLSSPSKKRRKFKSSKTNSKQKSYKNSPNFKELRTSKINIKDTEKISGTKNNHLDSEPSSESVLNNLWSKDIKQPTVSQPFEPSKVPSVAHTNDTFIEAVGGITSDSQVMPPIPLTPGKHLFISPPPCHLGIRLGIFPTSNSSTHSSSNLLSRQFHATPQHSSGYSNPFTSTPMSAGGVASFAAGDAAAKAKCYEQRDYRCEGNYGYDMYDENITSYLDRPPKTPGADQHLESYPKSPPVAPHAPDAEMQSSVVHNETGSSNKDMDCSTISEIVAPTDSLRSNRANPSSPIIKKGKYVLPKKSKEEIAKFIELFHRKQNLQ